MGDKFRFKNGDDISPWLTAEALREAARSKIVVTETQVQKAGREDWVSAGSISGLVPIVKPAVESETAQTPTPTTEPSRLDHKNAARPPESIHHLLHRALHTNIQVCAHEGEYSGDRFIQGKLEGLTVEGCMIEFPEFAAIVYIPLARVRSAVISMSFPALGPSRRGEVVRLEVDSLPDMSSLGAGGASALNAQSPASSATV